MWGIQHRAIINSITIDHRLIVNQLGDTENKREDLSRYLAKYSKQGRQNGERERRGRAKISRCDESATASF